MKIFFPFSLVIFVIPLVFFFVLFSEHAQDKQIQRDDEYYDGDHDNDQNTEDV